MGVTKAPAGSPSAGDEEVHEAADQAAVANPEPSTGTDANSAPSAQPSDKGGQPVAEKSQPSALDALKARLVHVEPAETDTAEAAPAADPVADASADVSPEATDAADIDTDVEAPAETAEDEDPLHGFSDRERQHPSNKGMVERIRKLAAERKEFKAKVDITEPVRQAGEFLVKTQRELDLTPQEVDAALKLSASYKRGDPDALDALEDAARVLRADLGVEDERASLAAVEPFKGVLPTHWADAVAALGFKEEDVRLLIALEAQHKTAKTQPQRPVQRAPVVDQRRADPDAKARQERAYAESNAVVTDFFVQNKIPREKVAEHIQKNLWPHLTKLAGGHPAKIPAEDRLRLATLAHQRWTLDQAKRRAAERAKAAPTLSSAAPPAPVTSTAKPQNDLDRLKARMVSVRRG